MRPSGPAHYNWKGGRIRNAKKARHHQTKAADHPYADSDGYVMTHRLIAERVLGRYLEKRYVVHHVDRNGSNNAHTNLVICEDSRYHELLHQRMRAYEACGDANARLCWLCRKWDRGVKELGNECAHKVCRAAYDRQRYVALYQKKGSK